jgi:hypothetical protein
MSYSVIEPDLPERIRRGPLLYEDLTERHSVDPFSFIAVLSPIILPNAFYGKSLLGQSFLDVGTPIAFDEDNAPCYNLIREGSNDTQ